MDLLHRVRTVLVVAILDHYRISHIRKLLISKLPGHRFPILIHEDRESHVRHVERAIPCPLARLPSWSRSSLVRSFDDPVYNGDILLACRNGMAIFRQLTFSEMLFPPSFEPLLQLYLGRLSTRYLLLCEPRLRRRQQQSHLPSRSSH